jgi:hypothetical protein
MPIVHTLPGQQIDGMRIVAGDLQVKPNIRSALRTVSRPFSSSSALTLFQHLDPSFKTDLDQLRLLNPFFHRGEFLAESLSTGLEVCFGCVWVKRHGDNSLINKFGQQLLLYLIGGSCSTYSACRSGKRPIADRPPHGPSPNPYQLQNCLQRNRFAPLDRDPLVGTLDLHHLP